MAHAFVKSLGKMAHVIKKKTPEHRGQLRSKTHRDAGSSLQVSTAGYRVSLQSAQGQISCCSYILKTGSKNVLEVLQVCLLPCRVNISHFCFPLPTSFVKVRLPVAALRSTSSSHSLSPYWEMEPWRWKASKLLQNTTRNHHCLIFSSCWDLSFLNLWGIRLHKAGTAKARKCPDHDWHQWHNLQSSSFKYG